MIQYAAQSGERTWKSIQDPDRSNPSSRDLFTYALALCEAKTHPDRLEKLFETAAKMQDRDPKSRGFGNFRWSWSHPQVQDFNAVDFCMQGGSLLWLRHRDIMPPAARTTLKQILDDAVQGLLRHRVPDHYTNIALMNAGDLIILGGAIGDAKAAAEGYTRLERAVTYTWNCGTHEYCSPTYYGTDLDDLLLIEAFAQQERGRDQARAMLQLLWTDIAMNWFAPSEKLGGTRSRDYDYLRGLGSLDTQLWANGWLEGAPRGGIGAIFPALGRWTPDASLRDESQGRLPRLIRQSWGPDDDQVRTHYVCKDISLSTSGAYYGGQMDLPLTVDLSGPRESVRCYFIADGRHDPYGKAKIAAGPHQKALHLPYLFTGAQRNTDALGLVMYRERDFSPLCTSLESHFVMPRDVDQILVAGRAIDLPRGTGGSPVSVPLGAGQSVILRKGTAAVGIRVAWARGWNGGDAPAALVWDGNASYGAIRLTVDHHMQGPMGKGNPGAVFWVRIGSNLDDAAFAAWCKSFDSAKAAVEADASRVLIRADGIDGNLSVGADAPYVEGGSIDPPVEKVVLEVNGDDNGRKILRNVEPIKSMPTPRTLPPLAVPAKGSLYFEAESGLVVPAMVIDKDPLASGGAFVWMPGEVGGKGGGQGGVSFKLAIPSAGDYYVWGRVLSPSPEDDSFNVKITQGPKSILRTTAWNLGTHKQWTWVRMALPDKDHPALNLPAGESTLHVDIREDGTKIDRLFITSSKDEVPR